MHSGSILIHQNTIKLADFGLSKRIEEGSKSKSKSSYEIIPYIDPKRFSKTNSNNPTQMYSLNKKSDVYSVGVILWEISSGRVPFYTEGEQNNNLAMEILRGLRETIVPDTPEDYSNLYTSTYKFSKNLISFPILCFLT